MNSNMNLDLIRAWKDEEYRDSLNAEQLALVPANPAGELVELTDYELAMVDGGSDTVAVCISAVVSGAIISAAISAAVSLAYTRQHGGN